MVFPPSIKQLIEQADIPVLIMGNPAFFDYELIPLDDDTDGRNWRPRSGRPSECLGVLGIVDGISQSALVQPLEAQAVDYICKLFAAHVQRRNEIQEAEQREPEDLYERNVRAIREVKILDQLYALEDRRGG